MGGRNESAVQIFVWFAYFAVKNPVNPCKPVLGKPTVATVPPNFTPRLAATGDGENFPSGFNNARSLAASTFTPSATDVALSTKAPIDDGDKDCHTQPMTVEEEQSFGCGRTSNIKFLQEIICGLSLLMLLCGCSSVGSHVTATSTGISVTKAVFLEPVPPDLSVYSPEIISFLQAKGFVFVEEKTGDCLRLKVTFEPDPWHRVVGIELLDSERQIVVSQAVNPGWGNIIASGTATANLAHSALAKFKTHCSAWLKSVTLREPAPILGGRKRGGNGKGFGTGFFVARDGRVLTAYHVIEGASRIVVKLADGTEHDAELDKVDMQNDLAVLRTKRSTEEFLELESAKSLGLGQTVFTLGFPAPEILGEQVKFTGGQVSSLSGIRGSESLLQVTVPIQPGNSGGPLLTENGKVVGIVTSTAGFRAFLRYTGTLPQNVNWAVKADYAQLILDNPSTASKLDSKNKSDLSKAICLISVE